MTLILRDFLPLSHEAQDILHTCFESLACAVAYRFYKRQRQTQGDAIPSQSRQFIILGAAIGSVLGSRAPGLLESSVLWNPMLVLTKKTIVGGLLGAWLAVECTKLLLRETRSSGDLFTEPLILAMMLGRVGCFLSGTADATYGSPTRVPWAVDFGDGVFRHPTQIYEFIFLAALMTVSRREFWAKLKSGSKFRWFLFSYLGFRLGIDFWKPLYRFSNLHLAATQWCALFGLILLSCLGGLPYVRSRLHFLRYEYQHLFPMLKKSGSQGDLRE